MSTLPKTGLNTNKVDVAAKKNKSTLKMKTFPLNCNNLLSIILYLYLWYFLLMNMLVNDTIEKRDLTKNHSNQANFQP